MTIGKSNIWVTSDTATIPRKRTLLEAFLHKPAIGSQTKDEFDTQSATAITYPFNLFRWHFDNKENLLYTLSDGPRHSFHTCYVSGVRESLLQNEEDDYFISEPSAGRHIDATEYFKVWWDEEGFYFGTMDRE